MSVSNLLKNRLDNTTLKVKVTPQKISFNDVVGTSGQLITSNASNQLEWLDTNVGTIPLYHNINTEANTTSSAYIIMSEFTWDTPILEAGNWFIETYCEISGGFGNAQIGVRVQNQTNPAINPILENNVRDAGVSDVWHSCCGWVMQVLATGGVQRLVLEGRVNGGTSIKVKNVRYKLFRAI